MHKESHNRVRAYLGGDLVANTKAPHLYVDGDLLPRPKTPFS